MTEDETPAAGAPVARVLALRWVLGPLSGALALMAIVFHVQGWDSMARNSKYEASADGTGWLVFLAFLFSIVGLVLLLVVLTNLAAGGYHKAYVFGLPLAGAVLIAWPGWQFTEWVRGPMLDIAWTVPLDGPGTVSTQGLWVTDDGMVIRGREDALIAHDPRDGERRWSVDAPVRMSLCSMSDSVSQGIGIVVHQRHEKPCASVSAVDLDSGRILWRTTVVADDLDFAQVQGGRVAVDQEVAVAATEDGARAFGLRDGKPRWTYRADDDYCGPALVSAAGGRTRIVEVCDPLGADKVTTRVLTLDSGNGKELHRQDLPTETSMSEVGVISAEPLVIQVKESDERGLDAVVAFERDSGEPMIMKRVGTDGEIFLEGAVVHGGTLFAITQTSGTGKAHHVSAYSLRDGERRWLVKVGDSRRDSVQSLTVAGGRIGVYVNDQRVLSLDPYTGAKQHDHGAVIDEGATKTGSGVDILAGPDDGWILVNLSSGSYPPLVGLTPKD
ncbi:PQQ-binding-like beta-propeller repeat protein [Streptomyces uncialis]|uniref:outer membrane protein assembly factor BamB family protein n=1 Tax=Streptomyces uncialis TaxID=1048205 RepID=UPI0037B47DB7